MTIHLVKIILALPSMWMVWLTAAAFMLLQSSCNTPRYVYSPAAHNVPMLTQKGDSKLGVLYSSNSGGDDDIINFGPSRSDGIDVQAAYAVSNHWAMMFNYFYRHEKNGDDFNSTPALIRYNRNLTELGAGYFTSINSNKSVFFHAYAGAGAGKFKFKDYQINGTTLQYRNFHQADVFKFFLQPAIMYQYKKISSVAVSSRFSILNYTNIKTNYDSSQLALYELATLKNGPVVFWEPAFVYAQGLKKFPFIRLELQAGMSALLSRRFVDARTLNFSLGFQADMLNLFKKKQPKKD
ncbi:MAG: hypothetical protein EOP53_22060 [Sphingobacteriales bacterium]|nr:MAG: hypothetical protein EOP53_22060 [Sphingobacteriales bacterium]